MFKTGSALTLGLVIGAFACAAVACSDDAADGIGSRNKGGSSGAVGADGGPLDPNDPNNPNGDNTPDEQKKFFALQPDFDKKCGNACHNAATYKPTPPAFLAGATPVDVYKTIKAHPGIVVRDVYQSLLLTKGPHAGPAISDDADFEKRITEWLEAESVAIQAIALPTTDPFTVAQGANDIDISKMSAGKLTGVHLKFDASLVGGMLSLSNMKLSVPAGTDVHLLEPRFIRELATPLPDGTKEVKDPQDSFSNTDQTVPGGADTSITPGSVFFSGDGWRPYDLAKDKVRIEAVKLEPGKVQVIQQAATCKNVANFTANVLPLLRGGASLNCSNCHGNGLAGLQLNAADQTLVCNQVLSKTSAPPNFAKSLLILKPTDANTPHSGGKVTDTAGFITTLTNNQAVFY